MFRSIARLFSVPDKLPTLALVRGMSAQMQLNIVSALLRSDVMRHLNEPRTLDELCTAAHVTEPEILRHLLDLGVKRRVLRRRSDRYSARSRLARCVAQDPSGGIAAFLHEVTIYHHDVFDRLPERMRGEPAHDYLNQFGELVAQSSSLMAPWICEFTTRFLGRSEGRKILELGCGAGMYLRHYASMHEGHCGVGIDYDAGVVADAQMFIDKAGLTKRFSIKRGDMRDASSWPPGPFDVITAHQNVYYFTNEERAALWRTCHKRLSDSGQLIVVTPTSGGPMSDYFSLILSSTKGCYRLPSVDELRDELEAANFTIVRQERLIPGDAIWGLAARTS